MTDVVIDPEFRDLIQPLTDEERSGLEAMIKAEGCRDALVCWGDILIDGHNRYEICTRLGIPFETKQSKFLDRESAIEWIILNQLSRRNLSLYQRSILVLKRDSILKARAKERMVEGGKNKGIQISGYPESKDSRSDIKLAEMAGTSHDTIHRVRVIEKEADAETKEKLAKGETTIAREYKKIRKPEHKPSLSKNERIGVIRELSAQGYKSDQIAQRIGITQEHTRALARESSIVLPDASIGGVRKLDVNRIVSETVMSAQSLTSGLELIDSRIDGIDASKLEDWITSLSQSVNALNRLIRKLKGRLVNEQQNGGKVQLAG